MAFPDSLLDVVVFDVDVFTALGRARLGGNPIRAEVIHIYNWFRLCLWQG